MLPFTTAQADTSVTLYGSVTAGYAYEKVSGPLHGGYYSNTKTGAIDAGQPGSRWGLKIEEDIGNGTTVVAQLESGFNLLTGESKQGGRLFGRQSTLGLSNKDWGRLEFGRQTNISNKYGKNILDPLGSSYNQLSIGMAFSSLDSVRYDNMVMYQSPTISGFQGGIGYSSTIDGEEGSTDDKAITTGLRYNQGAVKAFLVYDRIRLKKEGMSHRLQAWAAGMSYDFDALTLSLGFGKTKDGWFAGGNVGDLKTGSFVAAEGFDLNSYHVGLAIPMGNGQIGAAWRMADPRRAAISSKSVYLVGDELEKQNVFALGYSYKLSKRTNLYTYASYAKNAFFQDGLKSRLVSVGIRHRF
ncbi:Outer membrane porin protein BP0840 precursor [Oligella ureolytica]|uniref:Outer membrane porin protein BP0840 n=1 Tax=Oligella ureolytica TaxID=90244 RepID=A0A378XH36_9BURK|nr:porin [Oligella ureolytica]SUA52414.1 Outer membrane porin protein BP0840 precursor [Oligella ureolytica]SUA57210.1 Outer membrane porin protein BP0840 precursor [Oligella ureolytica]